jgi:3-hydroxyacyl-CoA dehydrogenase
MSSHLKREGTLMDIHKIACVGAGLIGQGWATLFSSKGFEVILQDVNESILQKAVGGIKSNLMFLEANNLLKTGEANAALKRIKTSTHLDEVVCGADYIQESVPDDCGIKKRVFKEMDVTAPHRAIFASSSSGLLMTEIQKATTRPERCVFSPFTLSLLLRSLEANKPLTKP